jgi:CBS domain-containing protein
MTKPVISLFAEQTLPLADDIMRYKHVRHLPVIDDASRLVGLVSHRDLLAARGNGEVRVGEIMKRDVWSVRPDVNASIAAETLLRHKFGCLPVVDDAGMLIAIVTEHDFLRFATKVLEGTD